MGVCVYFRDGENELEVAMVKRQMEVCFTISTHPLSKSRKPINIYKYI